MLLQTTFKQVYINITSFTFANQANLIHFKFLTNSGHPHTHPDHPHTQGGIIPGNQGTRFPGNPNVSQEILIVNPAHLSRKWNT